MIDSLNKASDSSCGVADVIASSNSDFFWFLDLNSSKSASMPSLFNFSS